GGVVGLTTALLLAFADLSLTITLIDSQPPQATWQEGSIPPWDIRTSAITRFTQRIWQDVGVWPLMAERRIAPYSNMLVCDAGGFGELHFTAAEIGEPDLGHIIENSVLLSSLWTAVQQQEAITLMVPTQLNRIEQSTNGKVLLTDKNGDIVSTQLLIGADGANSWVRQQLDIVCDKKSYKQAAVIATVATEKTHDFIAWQRFLTKGPLAFLPLSDAKAASIVWTQSIEEAPQFCAQTKEQQALALKKASDGRFGEVRCLNTPRYFPLTRQHVRQYVKPGIALVGDAAHVMHPLAGQGVNVGIKDAWVLTEEIKRMLTLSRQPLGNYWALRRYERHRRAEVTEMLGLVGGLNTLFKSSSSLVRTLRSVGMSCVNDTAFLKSWLMKQALGV
ncbi:MAG: hypothetical protein RLZ35_662, partial [Pseudomonadota bacterium]